MRRSTLLVARESPSYTCPYFHFGRKSVAKRWLYLASILALCCVGSLAQKQASAENDRQVLQEILQQTYQASLVRQPMLGFRRETHLPPPRTIVVVQRPGLYGSLLHSEPAS